MCISAYRPQKLAARLTSDDENELKQIARKISDLLSANIYDIFERTKSVNEEQERIVKRQRECVEEQNRLRSEEHDKEQQTVQRMIELEDELKQAKGDIKKLSYKNRQLQQSLDQTVKSIKMQEEKVTEPEGKAESVPAEAQSKTEHSVKLEACLRNITELLSKTKQEINETRQRLSDVQERLTVAEQVTAATQQRELQESDNSEQLKLELTPQHQPTMSRGLVKIYRL